MMHLPEPPDRGVLLLVALVVRVRPPAREARVVDGLPRQLVELRPGEAPRR